MVYPSKHYFPPFIRNKNMFLALEDKLPTRCPTAGMGCLWGALWKKKIFLQQMATSLPAPRAVLCLTGEFAQGSPQCHTA